MLLYAIFNSLPNFIDIETNCLRNYNMLELCRQSFIGGNKVLQLATMYWKSPSYEIFSDRKKDCKFYAQFIAGTSSLSSFSHYISLVLFRRGVCYSVIAESFKQIYEIFFPRREKAGIWLKSRFDKGNMYHAYALTKTTLSSPYHHAQYLYLKNSLISFLTHSKIIPLKIWGVKRNWPSLSLLNLRTCSNEINVVINVWFV